MDRRVGDPPRIGTQLRLCPHGLHLDAVHRQKLPYVRMVRPVQILHRPEIDRLALIQEHYRISHLPHQVEVVRHHHRRQLQLLLQLQHQLAATGYTWGCVAGLIGGNDLKLYRYKARPKLIADIRRRVREFWTSIAEGREPPVDGSDSASAVLRSLYGEVIDDAIDMSGSNEWPEAVGEFVLAGERRKAANEDYDAAKNRVVSLLGGHKRAYGSGYSVNTAITAATPDRPARPDEIIKGRAETRRYTAKFTERPA